MTRIQPYGDGTMSPQRAIIPPRLKLLGWVTDAGGGTVTVIVDRELLNYPRLGEEVWVLEMEQSDETQP